jgi:hypothetical protein
MKSKYFSNDFENKYGIFSLLPVNGLNPCLHWFLSLSMAGGSL